MVDW